MGAYSKLAGRQLTRISPSPAAGTVPTGAEQPSVEIGAAARSSVLNLAGAGVSAVLGLLLTFAATRLFPADVAGTFFVAMSAFLIAHTVAGVGAGVGAVYLLARRRALGEVTGLRAVFQVATPPMVVASVVVVAATWLAGPWLAELMAPESPQPAAAAMRVVAVFVPAAVMFTFYLSAIRGLGRTQPFVMLERLARPTLHLVAVGAVGVAAAAGAGVVTAAWAAPYLLLAGCAWVWTRQIRQRLEQAAGVQAPAPATRADWVAFWRFTAPRAVTSVAKMALQRLDVILIAALLGPVAAAFYVAASRLLVVGQLVNQALGYAVQHRFAALFATDDLPAARRLYQVTTGWLVVTGWPLFVLCIVFAEPILTLFGPQYSSAALVMRILSGVMLLAIACGMVSMVLEMAGRSVATLLQTLLALAANVTLNLLLIPRWGLAGAALAWAAAIALNNLIPFAQLYRGYRMQPIGRAAVLAMIAAAGCFGLLPTAALLLSGPALAVLATVIGAAGYLVVLWRARHTMQLDLLVALPRRLGRRPRDCPIGH